MNPQVLDALSQPLDPDRVAVRQGSGGRGLSYLEGHDVIRQANDIFGIGQWGYVVEQLIAHEPESFERNGKTGVRVGYTAVVKVRIWDEFRGTEFSDVGYGDATEYNGSAITPRELASKEAVTDALKRALKNFGDQFGLILYDKHAPEHPGNADARNQLTVKVAALARAQGVKEIAPASIAAHFGVEPADDIYRTDVLKTILRNAA